MEDLKERQQKIECWIKEAAKLGFKRVYIPHNNYSELDNHYDIELVPVKTIQQAVKIAFPR